MNQTMIFILSKESQQKKNQPFQFQWKINYYKELTNMEKNYDKYEFIKLNANVGMIIKNVKFVDLNVNIVRIFLKYIH